MILSRNGRVHSDLNWLGVKWVNVRYTRGKIITKKNLHSNSFTSSENANLFGGIRTGESNLDWYVFVEGVAM